MHTVRLNGWLLTAAIALLPAGAAIGDAACGCFSAKDAPVLQTAEQAFITWDPRENVETITIQPRVEGSAADFAIVVPTPSRPKLDTMPRDFFKHLAVYTTLKQRKLPQSRLLTGDSPAVAAKTSSRPTVAAAEHKGQPKQPAVAVLDAGAAGSLKYEVFEASRAEDLFRWLQ